MNDPDDLSGVGATTFRELGLAVAPRKGMALLFFPAFAAAGTIGQVAPPAASQDELVSPTGVRSKPGGKGSAVKTSNAANPSRPVRPLMFEAGQGDDRTLHAGAPTILGTKWIAQIWTHEAPYHPHVPKDNKHIPQDHC